MLNLRRCVGWLVAVLLMSGVALAQTPIAVTAAGLVQTYADNELRGDQRFQGQVVRVTGRVDDIAETLFGDPYIRLSAGLGGLAGGGLGELFRGVTCELASTAVGAAAQLSTGQNVTLEGVVDGLFVDVQMSDCRVAVEAMAERRVADAEGAEVRAARARIAEVVARAADARAEARVLSPKTEPRLRDWDAGALQSQVDESRARLAALAAPLPAPYQCPATAPKTEFETTVAFDARLASAQQACSDNTRRNEQELQTERTRRAAMTDTPLTLPLWNATAQYDADREVFLVNLLQPPDDRTLTLGIAPDRSVSARADDVLSVYAGRAWVCAVPVPLADAPTWRTSTSLLLSFRLASPSIDAPLSVADAGLLRVEQGVARLAATSLTECASETPAGYQGVVLVDPQVAVEAAARVAAEAAAEAAAAACATVTGRVYRPGNGVGTPQPLRQARPNYTSEAMRAEIQGEVIIEAVVLPDGTVGDVKVVRSLDKNFGLDEEALKAARQWRFRAGTLCGKPVAVLVTMALTFTLK